MAILVERSSKEGSPAPIAVDEWLALTQGRRDYDRIVATPATRERPSGPYDRDWHFFTAERLIALGIAALGLWLVVGGFVLPLSAVGDPEIHFMPQELRGGADGARPGRRARLWERAG